MNRSQVLITLLEEIAGTAAIVYHRTGEKAFIDADGKEFSGKAIPENIVKEGFAEGKSGAYGPGIYATYKLHSQSNQYMSMYGAYLVRCRINLQGYIILDYKEAKKVYRDTYALVEQLSQYFPPRWLDEESRHLSQYEDQLQNSPHKTTSNIALALYKAYQIQRLVPGMLFTGERDDAVVLTYKPEYIIPFSYAYHPVGTETPVIWTALDTSQYLQHIRKVGTLIRLPSPEKEGFGLAEFFQKLVGLTKVSRKEITQKFSNLKSLSMEYSGIVYKPDRFPPSLVHLIQQKFQDPDAEFYAVIKPILDQRFRELTDDVCVDLRKRLPDTLVECSITETETIKITFTFPSARSVLLFLRGFISSEWYDIQPVLDFLQSDTPRTREQLARSILEEVLPTRTDSAFGFPMNTYIDKFFHLVRAAPSTKEPR